MEDEQQLDFTAAETDWKRYVENASDKTCPDCVGGFLIIDASVPWTSYRFCPSLQTRPPFPSETAAATRGLVLAYQGQPFAAMYTRSCGGRTRTVAELGIPSYGYPCFPVTCGYCRRHLWRWRRPISEADADKSLSQGEAARLGIDRRLGWTLSPVAPSSHIRQVKMWSWKARDKGMAWLCAR